MASVAFHNVSKTYAGGVEALHDLNLTISHGELLVMVGPSGCGKTTALRLLAGLEEVSGGEIRINDQNVTRLSPQQRNIAMVFQNYALYPHMSVRGNLEFPLKMARTGRQERQRRLQQTAKLLGLSGLLERKPAELSGGQRQRVAMGRALVREPSVFLMDEPLSNLDAGLRLQIRAEIANLQRQTGTTTLYVTHDQVEAMTLGQRVAVLDRGRLQQIDTPQRLYQRPANVFVADFIGTPGMNFFATRLLYDAHHELCIDFNGEAVPIPPALKQSLAAVREQEHTLEGVIGGLRPEAFSMSQHGAHQRSLAVTVTSVEPLGHETLLYFNSPLQTIAAAALPVAAGANSDAGQIPMAARLAGNLNFCGNAGTVLFADVSKLLLFNRRGKRL